MQSFFRWLLPSLLVLSLASGVRAQSSEGTDFWFTFPEHRDPGNRKVALISARAATSGTLSIPGTGWSQNFSVGANQIGTVALPAGAETLGSETTRNAAVHLESNGTVSVYIHQYFGFRSEASLVLPTPVLGRDYLVMAYTGLPNDNTNYPSTFVVVPTEDGTVVDISALGSATEGGRPAGGSLTVTLDRGETYQVRAVDAKGDLTGTRIRSSAPVAVYGGAAWSGVPNDGCRAFDNLLEINYPISQWGREYLGVPTLNNNLNRYRVLAAEDGTLVTIDGEEPLSFALAAGEYRDFDRAGAVGIKSDRPVLAAEYLLGSQCNGHPTGLGDPSYFLLNELTQTVDTVTVFNSSFENITENYLNITFREGDEGGILLDGQPLTGTVRSSPDGEYAYVRVPVAAGSHTITSSGCGVIVTVYGYGEAESYAYGGGAAFRAINANPIPEGGCVGDLITFDTGLDTLRFRHEWTLEDGSTRTEARFERRYDELGEFPIRLIVEDICLSGIDTSFRDLAVTLRQAVDAPDAALACAGDTLILEAFDLPGARYEWAGPNGFEETGQAITVPNLGQEDAGVYAVVGNISGCRTFPAEVPLTVVPLPVVSITGELDFCARDEDRPLLDAGAFAAYRWSTGFTGNPLRVTEEGAYAVTVTDENGCYADTTVMVAEFCPLRFYVPTAFSPNGDGINDRFTVEARDFTAFSLEVYDRWGGLLFRSTAGEPSWNGRRGEEPVPTGSYLYVVTVSGSDERGELVTRVESGAVVLLR